MTRRRGGCARLRRACGSELQAHALTMVCVMHYDALMRYSWLSWLGGGVLAVCASQSAPVYASCVGSSTVDLLWSYPAEGDSDVPTNAQLHMVFNAKLYGTDWDATLNGEPIARSADGVFAFGPLAADTDYTFQLEGHQPRVSITTKVVELHFRTGSAVADAVQAPVVVGGESVEESDSARVCERVDSRYYCRDTAPFDIREVALDEANAVAWIDDAGNLWPRGCFPRVNLIPAQDRCYNMHAVSADGQISEATAFCPSTSTMGTMVLGQSQSATSSESCAVASVGGASSKLVPMPLLALIVAFGLRRCRRRN
jgi:MYXO-CTERM domain-containing protein